MARDFKQIDSAIDVVTPENISFQYQVAGPFRRFPAFLIDLAVRISIWLSCALLFSLTGLFAGIGGGEFGIAIWLVLWFVMEWFYGGLLETFWNGQTVGKRLLGIRVLRVDGQPINGLQAVMRNILRLVDMMPVIPMGAWVGIEGGIALPTCLIGLLTPVFNPRFQRMGDLVCGTMVVVEERVWLMVNGKVDDPRIIRLAADLPSSFQVTRKLGTALASYVDRRRFLTPVRRQEIAAHLGGMLVSKLNLPATTSYDLLLCSLYRRTFEEQESEVDSHLPADLLKTEPSYLAEFNSAEGSKPV
ncbi:MAG: RDD family protein [Planctomycetaceae bacterium]|nr:RDD family protein [Planctomycetaceae bacterium]